MTEPELLIAIETRAKEKAMELLSEVLVSQREVFVLDPTGESIEEGADRMLMLLFDQLVSFKGMI